MDLLIDGDIVLRKCAYVAEGKTAKEACQIVDDYLNSKIDYFLTYLGRAEYGNPMIYLKGATSFRKELCPEYHANRKDKKDPEHMETIREYLLSNGAKTAKNGYEVDDVLGYLQTKAAPQSTVIFSIDKDLLQIPGYHFNLDNPTLTYVMPYEGIKQFYLQMLIGDPVDNVKGVDGVGKVGAEKLLKGLLTEDDMYSIVYNQYNDEERLLKNSQLLWLKRADKENPVKEKLNVN